MTQTMIQDKVSKTSAFNGSSVDISGITSDWTIELTVHALSAGATARFSLNDSVDAFTNQLPGPVVHVAGEINQPKTFAFTKKDFPALRFGTSSAVLRLRLESITGSGTVVYQAVLKY